MSIASALARVAVPTRPRILAVLLVLAFGVYAVANVYAAKTGNRELGEFVIDSMAILVVVAAFLFRLEGGFAAAALAAAVAVAGSAGHLYEPFVLGTGLGLFALLALLVGLTTEALRGQTRMLARRDDLSLELLATLRNGRFVHASRMWSDLLGYPEDRLRGTRFLDLVHPEDLKAALRARSLVDDCHPVFAEALRVRGADGRHLWIEWSARIDPHDRLTYLAGRDVTARKRVERQLSEQQVSLERTVGTRTAELERRTDELERARREDLQRLAILAEYRDDDTAAHTERVGRLAVLIAQGLGLPAAELALLREAAPLHDIGKIGTPDSILMKPDPLTAAEWKVMQRHTELGARILESESAPVLQLAAPIALHHHERWDGTGYPRGLVGAEIPLSARIVAVADSFDALTHDRPYKPAWPIADALSEIQQLSGSQFDPEAVDALCHIPIATLQSLVADTRGSHELESYRAGRLRLVR